MAVTSESPVLAGQDDVAGYAELLSRRAQLDGMAGFEPSWVPGFLFPFQRALTEWAIWKGRGALLEDCGLGKSPQELVWAQNVHAHTGKPVLLLAPLGVTFQMQDEAAKFGVEAVISRDGTGGTSKRVRVRQLGNAVTPPVAEIIVSALVEAIISEDLECGGLELAA